MIAELDPWQNTSVAILAGGLGTRLRSIVADRPKVMAEVNGRPFFAFLLDHLLRHGLRQVVLCVGYQAHLVSDHFACSYNDLRLTYSVESQPLGTGGALRHALPYLSGAQVLVMNGDSYLDADLRIFLRCHEEKKADLSLLLAHVPDVQRYGSVQTDAAGLVTAFVEKGISTGPGMINGGIYLFSRELIAAIPTGRAVSLENEVFPDSLERKFYGFQLGGRFIDIGTPESFLEASRFFQKWRRYDH